MGENETDEMEGGGEEKRREIQDRGKKLGFSGWSKHFTPAWNQQPGCIGSHTCSSLSGHWMVLFSLGETPETLSAPPAALVPSVRCDTDEPAEFTFRSRRSSRRSISTESDGRLGPKTFSGNIPAGVSDVQLCSRSSVLQVATNRRNTEPGFNPDPPASFTE